MCGITGYWGGGNPEALKKSSDLIAHRGPDASGYWYDQEACLGLAHRRLSILDLSSAGAQPMLDDNESVVLVFNGEIYNFRELKRDIAGSGYRFRGNSDTEVIIALYLKLGIGVLEKLNGIFAFALYDKRSGQMLLARDALGVKPLYYSASQSGFSFSSEIKALVGLIGATREIDPISIHRYLTFQWCPGSGTPLKNIRKMGPGEAMIVSGGKIKKHWKWYQLPYCRSSKKLLIEGDIYQATTEAIRQAVNRQLVSDVPVGAFLSGGLDSSAVVALAREQVPDIRCFTIETEGGRDSGVADDLPYAKKVANHLNVHLDVIKVESGQMTKDIERMVYMLDEPLADPAAMNVYYISKLARDNGIKVLLSGAGGDDLFTGYWRHHAVKHEQLWTWLPATVRKSVEFAVASLDQRRPVGRRLYRLFNQAGECANKRMVGYFAWAAEDKLKGIYTEEFRSDIGSIHADQEMIDFLEKLPPDVTNIDKVLSLEQHYYLPDHNLSYTDKMSMAVGVEARVPFLDLDLVDFASKVPDEIKINVKNAKWVLKKAMSSYLPEEVIYRPKTGFGVPLRRWITHDLRDLVNDTLLGEKHCKYGIFNHMAVSQLIDDNRTGKIDGAYMIFNLLSMKLWLNKYINA